MKALSKILALMSSLICIGASNQYAYAYSDDTHYSHSDPPLLITIKHDYTVAGALRRTLRTGKNVLVDPNNEASVRRAFVMSSEGQAEISSALQNQEIQISGIERQLSFTRSVSISQLAVDDQVRLTALFKELVNDLPEEAFKSSNTLRKAMRERLERQLAESSSQSAPRYKFDVSSGKLTLPRLGRIGPLEISGGELDTHKLFKGIALVAIACGVTGCKCFVGVLFDINSLCIPSE